MAAGYGATSRRFINVAPVPSSNRVQQQPASKSILISGCMADDETNSDIEYRPSAADKQTPDAFQSA